MTRKRPKTEAEMKEARAMRPVTGMRRKRDKTKDEMKADRATRRLRRKMRILAMRVHGIICDMRRPQPGYKPDEVPERLEAIMDALNRS